MAGDPFWALVFAAALGSGSCGSDGTGLVTQQRGASSTSRWRRGIERGTRLKFTAIVTDVHDQVINVPVVWRSSNETAAVFDANGVLTAIDVGTTNITASSLGNTSDPTTIQVVWNGAADIASFAFTQPNAATPGAVVYDSIRVLVTNKAGQTVPGARVVFATTAGGGTVSPATATSSANGIASTQWTLGSTAGVNTVTATVVDTANQPLTFVQHSPVTFSVKSYAALSAVAGDHQTAQILADLPLQPSVKLVDSLGKPRPGVPITFSATTAAASPFRRYRRCDGVASPGTGRSATCQESRTSLPASRAERSSFRRRERARRFTTHR